MSFKILKFYSRISLGGIEMVSLLGKEGRVNISVDTRL